MNKPGSQTSEFKITLVVVVAVVALLVLSVTGVIDLDRVKSDLPVVLAICGTVAAGAYSVARGLTKAAEARSPYADVPKDEDPLDGGGDGAR